MELKRLKIDEEFRHLIRPLRHREFLQLEQNIINDGCRDPIVVWHDTIVDGITVMKFVCATASPLIQRIWNLSAERLLSPGYVLINSEEETLPKRLASSLLVCSTRMKNWLPEFAIR